MSMMGSAVIHALACARMACVHAMMVGSQFIKCFLLAGVEAVVEAARCLLALFGFGHVFFAQFLHQVQALGGGQLAHVWVFCSGASARLGRDGFDILVPGGLLAGLQLQQCLEAFCALCMGLGKVRHAMRALVRAGLRCGCLVRVLRRLGMGGESQGAQDGGSGHGVAPSACNALHNGLLSGVVECRPATCGVHACQCRGGL